MHFYYFKNLCFRDNSYSARGLGLKVAVDWEKLSNVWRSVDIFRSTNNRHSVFQGFSNFFPCLENNSAGLSWFLAHVCSRVENFLRTFYAWKNREIEPRSCQSEEKRNEREMGIRVLLTRTCYLAEITNHSGKERNNVRNAWHKLALVQAHPPASSDSLPNVIYPKSCNK